ncbi:glutathione hydrolase 1 proenzyme-like [Mya arenaria]|uniref:glutathione hydrolase 1 proenzyme-like n=1 Tax=Mya arenaria TaxID=6604 RepID=UPI0022E493A6|nr:glutathione hydrolase 1 proenzyme-like [Mya arenaria]
MASDGKYDKLEEPINSGDKADLLDNDEEDGLRSNSPGSPVGLTDLHSLKDPRKVLEAGKAVLQDQSRGLRIIVICAFIFSIIITIALILSIYLGPPQIGANAAISTGVQKCSDIGLQMLTQGGNAVDAAVAAMFCMGVVNAESSGLGGGGFMLVHDHKVEKSEVYDFREMAPNQAKPDMFSADSSQKELGPLYVAVPGELRGMEKAHKKYGILKWKNVVSPAADLARNGFHMTGHTDVVLNSPKFNMEAFKESKLAQFYMNEDKTMKKEGDLIVRSDLAATLDQIAADGAEAFYSGNIADSIVEAIVNADNPGVLTKEDLMSYSVEMREVVKTTYHGYTVESVPAPGGGPVVLFILNFMEGYGKSAQDNATYHQLVEAFKFGNAHKEQLGDPGFNAARIKQATEIMISKEEAAKLRNLTTDTTQDASFYRSKIKTPEDAGTAHISVIDTAELMVSVTTTINTWFGSMVLTDTGILLNNEMADFGESGDPMNAVEGKKRPLSSMAPTVVYETGHLCGLRMACGGVNGSRIITGVAEVLFNNLSLSKDLTAAIAAPRLHSALYPDPSVVEAEAGFSEPILSGLKGMGHTIQRVPKELSIVNAVLKIKDNIESVADKRKPGSGSALFK